MANFSTFGSYMLLVVAPFASTLLALRWFSERGTSSRSPPRRLARVGRWRGVSGREAERHPLYGTSGIMVSLLVGMMLNVPVRAAEYLAATPPIPLDAPRWLSVLHFAMTADVVVFSSLYMIAFVAALRRASSVPAAAGGDLDRRSRDAAGHRADGQLDPRSGARRRRASDRARGQCEEGADQHGAVAALFAAFDAGERHIPAAGAGLDAISLRLKVSKRP